MKPIPPLPAVLASLALTRLALAGLALACLSPATAAAASPAVPLDQTVAPTPSVADTILSARTSITDPDGVAIEIGIWHPAQTAHPRPLIVISHGNGGDFRSHEETARALAAAGFVVAALTHTGDNWRDQSRATEVHLRPRQLSILIDHMTRDWEGRSGIDPDRIGAFGFSAGGFTVLAAGGGRPDLGLVHDHCRQRPGFYDCRLVAARGGLSGVRSQADQTFTPDRRIKAIVAAAPALGFTFTPEGLSTLTVPVQLWRAEQDTILPSPFYTEPVRDGLPGPVEYHVAAGAGHFDFLPPCPDQLAAVAPAICAATPGLDRRVFHPHFAREVVRFFRAHL